LPPAYINPQQSFVNWPRLLSISSSRDEDDDDECCVLGPEIAAINQRQITAGAGYAFHIYASFKYRRSTLETSCHVQG